MRICITNAFNIYEEVQNICMRICTQHFLSINMKIYNTYIHICTPTFSQAFVALTLTDAATLPSTTAFDYRIPILHKVGISFSVRAHEVSRSSSTPWVNVHVGSLCNGIRNYNAGILLSAIVLSLDGSECYGSRCE